MTDDLDRKRTQYQLVLQRRSSAPAAFDEMVHLEERLAAAIDELGIVDGHDVGAGEVNIFILTAHPTQVFERIKLLPEVSRLLPQLQVAFRIVGSEAFEILHPPGLRTFKLA